MDGSQNVFFIHDQSTMVIVMVYYSIYDDKVPVTVKFLFYCKPCFTRPNQFVFVPRRNQTVTVP